MIQVLYTQVIEDGQRMVSSTPGEDVPKMCKRARTLRGHQPTSTYLVRVTLDDGNHEDYDIDTEDQVDTEDQIDNE